MSFWYIALLVLAGLFLIGGILLEFYQKRCEKMELEQSITKTINIRDILPNYKKKKESSESLSPVILDSEFIEDHIELKDEEKI